MKNLYIPEGYTPALDLRMTQVAIKKVKDFFERDLAIAMKFSRRYRGDGRKNEVHHR